jgi:hypothetical protein
MIQGKYEENIDICEINYLDKFTQLFNKNSLRDKKNSDGND